MERRFFDLNASAAGVAQRQQLGVHRHGHVPDHLARILVRVGVSVEEQAHDLRAAGAETHRLRRFALGDPPDLRVVERPMLDPAGHPRPAPGRVDFVEQRAGRITQPRAARLLRLQIVAREAGPSLQRVVMPAAAGEVLVAVKVAVGENVEPGPLLVADDHGEGVLEFLAEADVQHAGVERPAPHADVEPPRPRPRPGYRAGQDDVFGDRERHTTLGVAILPEVTSARRSRCLPRRGRRRSRSSGRRD
jgi:hypothetical protein